MSNGSVALSCAGGDRANAQFFRPQEARRYDDFYVAGRHVVDKTGDHDPLRDIPLRAVFRDSHRDSLPRIRDGHRIEFRYGNSEMFFEELWSMFVTSDDAALSVMEDDKIPSGSQLLARRPSHNRKQNKSLNQGRIVAATDIAIYRSFARLES